MKDCDLNPGKWNERGTDKKTLSIVIPCFNEDSVIGQTHKRLHSILTAHQEYEYELIYVDDGSRDGTFQQLEDICSNDRGVKILRLSRNFGHQVAVTAGIEHAHGDAIILIDADLQDPPEVIFDMVEKWEQGYDVVYGVRAEREGESLFKLMTSTAFYRIINWLSDVKIPLDTGDFRLMDRRVVESLNAMPERDRFIRGMVSWVGYRQIGIPYRRAPRAAGVSKYPVFKMIKFAADGILSFSIVPLRLAIFSGLGVSGIALLGIIYATGVRLFSDQWVPGWATVFTAVLFLGGIQLLSLGIIGEFIGRIYGESKSRPLYFVQDRVGFDSARTANPSHKEYILTTSSD